jgi:uncharacterized metal-binding protein YceD (DUF177 family)
MTASREAPPPEFSMEVDLGEIGKSEKRFRLAAGEDERRKVAARFKIPAIDMLEGELRIRATKTDIFVEGDVRALLTRECVASLEPVREDIAEAFEIHFTRQAPEREGEEEADLDAPEVHEGDVIDLGELLVQQLALAMDPFPRKEGAPGLAETYGGDAHISPFAALKGAFKKSDENQ